MDIKREELQLVEYIKEHGGYPDTYGKSLAVEALETLNAPEGSTSSEPHR